LFSGPIGKPNRYIGASAGCWAIYEQVLAKEYGEYGYPDIHRLTVDTYAVQHPGVASRQSSQSVWVHLVGMHLVLNLQLDARTATAQLGSVLAGRREFEWLEPPPKIGSATIVDVNQARGLPEHIDRVRRWASQYGRRGLDIMSWFDNWWVGGRMNAQYTRLLFRRAVRTCRERMPGDYMKPSGATAAQIA